MTIGEVRERTPELVAQLTAVWEGSVRATHTFLSEQELMEIKKEVPGALRGVDRLFTAEDEDGVPAAFRGVEGSSLEMLFVVRLQHRPVGRLPDGALRGEGTEYAEQGEEFLFLHALSSILLSNQMLFRIFQHPEGI